MTASDSSRCGWSLPDLPGIAIVGASGLVGCALLEVLEQRGFPHSSLRTVALRSFDASQLADPDLIFLAAPHALARAAVPQLRRPGRILIDLSDAWRLEPEVPLVLDGVNDATLESHSGLVASPNCTNVGLVMVLHALSVTFEVARATVTSLQAASGGGRRMLEHLQGNDQEDPTALAGNLLAQCDALLEAGQTAEEQRLQVESARILGRAMPALEATCVRVPVEVGHALALTLHFSQEVALEEIRRTLARHADIHLAEEGDIPTPRQVRGKDGVYVGRVRHGSDAKTVQMWIVIDNLLTGAATNAVRIAEQLLP